jgi:glycosyltransferase involved in cell wall biosynthesis
MPKVSIAIPTYNSAEYLREAIHSILRQQLDNLEIVISDNASEDHTEEVVRSFQDPRIRYLRNEQNIGSGRNLDRCLHLATGEYVKLLCADDVLLDGIVARQVAVLDNEPGVTLVSCNLSLTDAELHPTGTAHFFPGHAQGSRLQALCLGTCNNYIGGPSNFLFRRRDAEGLSWDSSYKWIADLKFGLQLLGRGSYRNIDEPGYLYRRHAATVSALDCPADIRMPEFLRLADELDAWNLLTCVQVLRRSGSKHLARASAKAALSCAPLRLRTAYLAAADRRRASLVGRL